MTASEDHASAGFGGELEPGPRPAVLLVDPARAYVDPDCPLYAGAEAAAAAMRELVTTAREHGIPVITTRMGMRADRADGGLFARKVPATRAWVEGSRFAAFITGLEPDEDELVITKQYPSAFFGTGLQAHLTANRVDTVVLGGLSTSGCVRASALDALQHGFVPIVTEEAVDDRDAEVHAANLFDIRQKIGEVWPLARVQRYLGSGNQRPTEIDS